MPGEKAGYHVSASWVVLAEIVRVVSGPALKADAATKTLTLTLKPGETAVLGYSFR